ncbi:mCG1042843, partial [Mus musculus]
FSPEALCKARACAYCRHHSLKSSDTSTSCVAQALAGEVVMGLFLAIIL